ncbi:MAG: hypothetical protein IPL86_13295 [Flavobacteriales bacterium]|nr:hypothetical protein [Flavobacteriales bacterium]
MAGGVFRKGDKVHVLPSGFESTIKSINIGEYEADERFAPQSARTTWQMRSTSAAVIRSWAPTTRRKLLQDVEVMLCWFNEKPLQAGASVCHR